MGPIARAAGVLSLLGLTAACVPARISVYTSPDARETFMCNHPNVHIRRAIAPEVDFVVLLAPSGGIGLRVVEVHLREPRRVRALENRIRIESADLASPLDVDIGPLLGVRVDSPDRIPVEPGAEMSTPAQYFSHFTYEQRVELERIRPAKIALVLPTFAVDGEPHTPEPIELELKQYWTVVGLCQ